MDNITKDINSAQGDAVQAVKRYDVLKQAYIADKGIGIHPQKLRIELDETPAVNRGRDTMEILLFEVLDDLDQQVRALRDLGRGIALCDARIP